MHPKPSTVSRHCHYSRYCSLYHDTSVSSDILKIIGFCSVFLVGISRYVTLNFTVQVGFCRSKALTELVIEPSVESVTDSVGTVAGVLGLGKLF
ncbi:uncharacterized protein BDV14DRAFT_166546 [Aspergillus stella-maris]|uniref:uncharacterized protein n=1 Tax=Aspergillus stella-maris TaxID=1810926 RepID=UPI003CCDC646